MTDTLLAALVAALLAGLGGPLVPRLVARVPEPAPRAEPEGPEPGEPEPAKMLYTEVAARPGLGWRSAVAGALIGGLIGWATGLDWPLVWLVPLIPIGVALSVIDWHTKLLPRVVVVPATLAAVVLVVIVGLATGEREALVRALVAMVVVRTFYWVLWSVLPGVGMGFGDVRLAAIVGLVLGWSGWGAVAIGVWVGMAAFGLPGLALAIIRWDRKLLKKPFPFGPFMLVGAVVGLVWGTVLAGRIWG